MISEDLFVYGTLRSGAAHRMSRLLAGRARFVDRAVWQGKLYLVRDYPGAVPSDDPLDRVHGEVYRLLEPQRLLAELDRYEGCSPAFPAAAEYERRRDAVRLAGGGRREVWIYIFRHAVEGLPLLKTGDFLKEQQNSFHG